MNRRRRTSNKAHLAWLVLAALPLLVGAGGTTGELSEEQLEEELLVGIFEGHGMAEPSDPEEAQEARRVAQRLGQQCFSRGVTRGGGSEDYAGTCGISPEISKGAAAAILDELNDPRVAFVEGRSLGAWERLLHALTSTHRKDVVPVLITAMHRIELRELAPGRLRQGDSFGISQRDTVEQALERLTYVDVVLVFPPKADYRESRIIEWRAWLAKHGDETRAQWRAQAIEGARQAAKSDETSVRYNGVRHLLEFSESRAEGVRAALAMKRDEPDYAQTLDDLMRSAPNR